MALLPWGNVLEDFFDTIGVSLDVFCEGDETSGGLVVPRDNEAALALALSLFWMMRLGVASWASTRCRGGSLLLLREVGKRLRTFLLNS
jgi:hypothetical protein